MNICILSGRLTKKPELRTTQTLKHVCQFSIAVENTKIDENGKRGVDFIECVCFDKIAENLVKYQDKGSMIELKGRIQVDRYVDKNNKNVSKTLIYVETINYINSTKTNDSVSKNEQKDAYQEMSNRIQNELPF